MVWYYFGNFFGQHLVNMCWLNSVICLAPSSLKCVEVTQHNTKTRFCLGSSCLFVLISFRHVQMTFHKSHNVWNFLKNCWQKSENLSFNFHTRKMIFKKSLIWGNFDDFKKISLFYSVSTLSEVSPCAIHKNIMPFHLSWPNSNLFFFPEQLS